MNISFKIQILKRISTSDEFLFKKPILYMHEKTKANKEAWDRLGLWLSPKHSSLPKVQCEFNTFHLSDLKVGIMWLLTSSLGLQTLTPKLLNNCSTWERPISSSKENKDGCTVERSFSSTENVVCSWDLDPGVRYQKNFMTRTKSYIIFWKWEKALSNANYSSILIW